GLHPSECRWWPGYFIGPGGAELQLRERGVECHTETRRRGGGCRAGPSSSRSRALLARINVHDFVWFLPVGGSSPRGGCFRARQASSRECRPSRSRPPHHRSPKHAAKSPQRQRTRTAPPRLRTSAFSASPCEPTLRVFV